MLVGFKSSLDLSPQNFPIDLWFIDAYSLLSINLFPQSSAVIAALAIAVTAYLDHTRLPRWQNVIVITACALFVQIVNPIAFILADVAMAGVFFFLWWQKRKFDLRLALTLSLIAVIQIPLLVYSLELSLRDPAWALVTIQDVTLSPPPVYYLLGSACSGRSPLQEHKSPAGPYAASRMGYSLDSIRLRAGIPACQQSKTFFACHYSPTCRAGNPGFAGFLPLVEQETPFEPEYWCSVDYRSGIHQHFFVNKQLYTFDNVQANDSI